MGNRAVIDTDTGEKLHDFEEGDRLVKKKQIDFLEQYDVWKVNSFYKGNIDELKEVSKDLTIAESGFLFKILPYINYRDCLLCYSNGKDINQEDLAEITGMSRSQVYRTLESLISKDILYKGKNSKSFQYFVNPWLFVKGNEINKVLKSMFKNYKIRVLNTRWKNLK